MTDFERLLYLAQDAMRRAKDGEDNPEYAQTQLAKAIEWLQKAQLVVAVLQHR